MGCVYRRFKPKPVVNYDDPVILGYIKLTDDNADYSTYCVVPKTLAIADKALLRYDRHPDPFSDQIKLCYDIAAEWLELHFGPYLCNSRMFSVDEVKHNLQGDKSPGYPWSLKYPTKDDYWLSDDAIFYETYWEKLATSDYIRTLCSCTIKEELRPTVKVLAGDGRTIIAMDVNHVVASSQLCMHQNHLLISSVGEHFSCLGMNNLGGGFHRQNQRMSRFGAIPCTLERDGKKFDGSFRYYLFGKIRDFRFRMLAREYRTPDNYVRLHNLYFELAHSPLVNVDGSVFGREVGNPSGQASTTPDNGFKNFMDDVVLYLLSTPPEYHTYEQYMNNVENSICGDDINNSIHPDIQVFFNAASMLKHAPSICMEYHFPDLNFRHNYECTFLGHSYTMSTDKYGHNMWFPTIDCVKMRTSLVVYNEYVGEKYQIPNTIVRCCSLRSETWACLSCRQWFQNCYEYLRDKYGACSSPHYKQAFKSYKTDSELWTLYSGLEILAAPRVVHPETVITAVNSYSSARAPEFLRMPESHHRHSDQEIIFQKDIPNTWEETILDNTLGLLPLGDLFVEERKMTRKAKVAKEHNDRVQRSEKTSDWLNDYDSLPTTYPTVTSKRKVPNPTPADMGNGPVDNQVGKNRRRIRVPSVGPAPDLRGSQSDDMPTSGVIPIPGVTLVETAVRGPPRQSRSERNRRKHAENGNLKRNAKRKPTRGRVRARSAPKQRARTGPVELANAKADAAFGRLSAAIRDPFNNFGVKWGDSGGVTTVAVAYGKMSLKITTQTEQCFVLNPGLWGATGGTGPLSELYANTDAGALVNNSYRFYANATTLGATFNKGRQIALGLRVTMRCAMSSTAPMLYAGMIPVNNGAASPLVGLTTANITSDPLMKPVPEGSVQVTWRPEDFADIDTFGGSVDLVSSSYLAVVATGCTSACTFYVEYISIFEAEQDVVRQYSAGQYAPQCGYSTQQMWAAYLAGKKASYDPITTNFKYGQHTHSRSLLNTSSRSLMTPVVSKEDKDMNEIIEKFKHYLVEQKNIVSEDEHDYKEVVDEPLITISSKIAPTFREYLAEKMQVKAPIGSK